MIFAGTATAGVSADAAIERDATALGAVRSVRAASSVAGARGIIGSCPGRSFDFVESVLASATSLRVTPNLRATVSSVSPFFAVYHLNALKSAGEASASRAVSLSAVPTGTLTSYSGYFTG